MATWLGKALNRTTTSSELAALPGFKWKNKGSMVFIGDQNVSPVMTAEIQRRLTKAGHGGSLSN